MCEGGERIPDTQLSAGGGSPVPCSEAPKVAWGSPVPTWEGAGSLTLTLFDRLRLFGEVDFVGGITKIDGDIAAAHLFFRNSKAILEREDPILLGYDEVGGPFGQAGIIDGGFAKLRTVSVNYRLPPWLLAPLDMDRATLTVSGRNLGTLWLAQEGKFGRKQLDPERGENAGFGRTPAALDAFSQEGWPQFRRFTAVLRLSF